jgi:hypothetical protein
MRRRLLIVGSIIAIVAVAVILGFRGLSSKTSVAPGAARGPTATESSPSPTAQFDLGSSRDRGPFGTGQKFATVAEAEAVAAYHFVRPAHALANDALVRAVFFERVPGEQGSTDCSGSDVLHGAIDYTSGVLITIEHVAGTGCPFDLDPAGSYASMAASSEGLWQTTTIDGVSALVSPGYQKNSSPAFVDLTIQGVRVTIYAMYAPIDLATLTEVAETLT